MDAISFKPFPITIERVGLFKRKGGDIWWAGLHENKMLTVLHNDLTNNLVSAGFSLDKRNYSPHITLGREIVTNAVPWQTEIFGETVTGIDLMKSERINGKLTYTVIHKRKYDTTRNESF